MRVEYISCVGCTHTHSYKYRLHSPRVVVNENIFLTKTTRTHSYVLYMCIRRSMAAITVNRLPFTICRAQIKAKWIRINKLCKCRNWVSRHPTPDTRERRREYALGTLGSLWGRVEESGELTRLRVDPFSDLPRAADCAHFGAFSFVLVPHLVTFLPRVSFGFV